MAGLKSSLPKLGVPLKGPVVNPVNAVFMAAGLSVGVASRMSEGDSFGTSVLKEIPSQVLFGLAPGVGWTIAGAGMAFGAVKGLRQKGKELGVKYNRAHSSSPFFQYQDTQQAITMRQASIQAIQGSKINGRNALGGEAKMMHRNWSERML